MTSDRTTIAILLTTILVIAAPALFLLRALPPAELTPAEKELATFSSPPVSMAATPQPITFSGKICPVPTPPKPVAPVVKIPNLAGFADKIRKKFPLRTLSSNPVVSMIYYAGYTRMAIINNHVVHEGADFDGGTIVTIEKTRVLMRKAGKDIWLTTE
jgi:hypothetical protein